MASNTEHLNLLKKDPVADGNEYFNIETMLNENWDKIDEAVSDVQNRLNRSSTESITLQPGLQTINAKRDARFKLGEVRGRTLINLLGNRGECEGTDPSYYQNGAIYSVDTAVKHSGTASLKLVSNTTTGAHYFRFMNNAQSRIPVAADQCLLYGAWIKPLVNSGALLTLFFFDSGGNNISHVKSEVVKDTSKFSYLNILTKPPANTAAVLLQISITDANGNETFVGTGAEGLNLDSAYFYTITDSEYAALDGMPNDKIAEKYPFVPAGIIGVENPYAIATSENPIPPFYEWRINASGKIVTPYTYAQSQSSGGEWTNVKRIRVLKNADYYLSFNNPDKIAVAISNGDETRTLSEYDYNPRSFNTGEDSEITIYFNDTAGTISDLMLTLGTEPKPFEPQRKSMLAFQTELHANPTDGSDPDVLFEQDGEYRKLAKWKRVVLDGSLPWGLGQSDPGYKRIQVPSSNFPVVTTYEGFVAIKYDGTELKNESLANGADRIAHSAQDGGKWFISIANDYSGWGPDYHNLTQDEIKACMNGWVMYVRGGELSVPYNGVGTKAWYARLNPNEKSYGTYPDGIVPTAPPGIGATPYTLQYRLAKESVEPVTVEGCLTLSEGDNMIEVGTGIVLREGVKPKTDGTNYFINIVDAGYEQTRLKNKASKLLSIYRNNGLDSRWIRASSPASYGSEHAVTATANFDQSAAYSVTYFKLDKSPIVPINGSLAGNEKAQISDLTAGVAEALQRTSVLERQKAEKDAPSLQWIMPTLLNGWKAYADSRFSFRGYAKDGAGNVLLSGLITGASSGSGVPVFYLPEGYRPNKFLRYATSVADNTVAHIQITNEGQVTVINGNASSGISLTLQFPAER